VIGRTLLHYKITAELGAGMMGRVYAARDTHTGRRVALKLLSEGSEGRLRREAEAAAQLSHPGIVTLFALEQVGGEVFLVHELVEGGTLAERLARGPLAPDDTYRLARELAAALAHAHARGVFHRDLKPDNVLIAPDASFKIADFGLALVEGSPTLTESGTVVGSLGYLAPERLGGKKGDARGDLFALGAILYEAMSGRRAFAGDTPAAVVYSVLNVDPAHPRVDAALEPLADLALALLAKDPSRRPASAESVARLLASMTSGTRSRRAGRARARWRPVAGMATLAVTLGLLTLWVLSRVHVPHALESGIAVLPFENMVDAKDPSRMGSVVSNLLTASLAETQSDSILSSERVLEILGELGRVGAPMDRHLARAVAQRAHARRIVTGSILRVDPGLIVTAEMSEAASGRVVRAARVAGAPGASVFDVVDSLSARIQKALARAPAITAEAEKRGTSDLRAYQLYTEGLEWLARGEAERASQAFSAALERDPGFELASRQLGFTQWLRSSHTLRESP